jgi:hypothetical protein
MFIKQNADALRDDAGLDVAVIHVPAVETFGYRRRHRPGWL